MTHNNDIAEEKKINDTNNNDTDDDEIIDYFNLDNMKRRIDGESQVEEQVLSQQLSQLSTTKKPSQNNKRKRSDASTSLTTHRFIIEEKEDVAAAAADDDDEIPVYLSTTDPSFEQMIQQIPTNSMNIEELRHITILMHQCTMIKLKKSLWLTYFKAGTGTLKTEQPGPEIWPIALRSIVLSSKKNETNDNDDNNMDDRYLKFVNTRLCRFDHQLQQCQDKLHQKTKHSQDYETIIAPIIQSYIQQNLQSLHAQYEYTIALIGYDYEDHRLELEFLAQEPNHDQIELFKSLCNRKYEQEKAKQEYLLLKEQVTKNKLPVSFNSIQILLPSLIQTINDMDIRQYLHDQHRKLIQKYKNEMMTIFIKTAEGYMFQTQKLFDCEMDRMWQDHKTLSIHQRFHSIMFNLIDQRFKNMTEKLQCIYNYKMYHYFGKASMK